MQNSALRNPQKSTVKIQKAGKEKNKKLVHPDNLLLPPFKSGIEKCF
jgi:hypothetical protein